MLTLSIDIGNTRIKTGVFRNNDLISKGAYIDMPEKGLKDLFLVYPDIKRTIISSVAGEHPEIKKIASEFSQVTILSPSLKLPVTIRYEGTPGNDRIAVASAVSHINENGTSLVVDCGTCITYSLVITGNLFAGGAISPGLELRYKALNAFTANLPLLKFDNEFHHITGSSTSGSIQSGVLNGAVAEVSGMIEKYRHEYPELKVYITGGFSSFFEKALKNGIFADPDLVLKGLNYILQLNA